MKQYKVFCPKCEKITPHTSETCSYRCQSCMNGTPFNNASCGEWSEGELVEYWKNNPHRNYFDSFIPAIAVHFTVAGGDTLQPTKVYYQGANGKLIPECSHDKWDMDAQNRKIKCCGCGKEAWINRIDSLYK